MLLSLYVIVLFDVCIFAAVCAKDRSDLHAVLVGLVLLHVQVSRTLVSRFARRV